jgi:phosphotransferase system HPr (HPr) family protein
MPEPALKRTVTMANRQGMHLRPAMLIVTEARKFDARIVISRGLHSVEATEIYEVLSLAAERGDQLTLEGSGNQAQAAVEAIEQLFLRKFDEE